MKSYCPMTEENIQHYNVTPSQQERFCTDGCCPDCDKLFKKKFEKQSSKELQQEKLEAN